MNRIMILGGTGTGKTFLSQALAEKTGLPIVHMDQIYHLSNWEERPKDEVIRLAFEAISQPQWIIEGNHTSTLQARADRADLIIFLDMPRLTRMRRIVWRTLRHLGRVRPGSAPECHERFDFEFLKWAWSYDRDRRGAYREQLAKWRAEGRNVREVSSLQQLRSFLEEIG